MPQGNTLDDETFRRRHLLLCWILGLHVPALFAFGLWRGYGLGHTTLEVAPVAAALLFARLARQRRLAAFFATAGLVFSSYVIVHLSGGTIEAHFHFFILIGLIALYQDWVPFLWNVAFTVLSHGIGTVVDADAIYNHGAAQNRPWSWAAIHGVAVLAACIGVVIFWKNTEQHQQRAAVLARELAEAELESARAEAVQRQSVSELFVNLARRNQSLLDRQLGLIDDLEQRERRPDALAELFKLDHLATRIRRNAESLLVLSGDDPPRRWGRPVALGEVVRAAAAEVEDYQRVEVLVDERLEVTGRAVADLAHLLAELIENATAFSPPSCDVRVRSHHVANEGARFLLSVEDTGVGMVADDLAAANELLAEPPEVDLRRSRLGFHVVSRLAQRYGLEVRLADTPGGGLTALVALPDDLVTARRSAEPPSPSPAVSPAPGPATPAPVRPSAQPAVSTAPSPSSPSSPPSPASAGPRPAQPVAATPGTPVSPAHDVPVPAGAADAGGDPTVWTVPDADTLARLVAPPSRRTGLVRDGVFPPAIVVDARYRQPPAPRATPAPPGGADGPESGRRPADGLARRIPGAGLPAALRRTDEPDRAVGEPGPAARDGYRVRSMLSRFQASQRAGRAAAAEAPPDPHRRPEDEA